MSHQSKLFGIRKLTREVQAEYAKILGNAPEKRTYGHALLEAKIECWQNSYVAILKSLTSQSHFNRIIYQQQRFKPNAYSAHQSFTSREANVGELFAALADLEVSLRNLVGVFVSGKPAIAAALDAIGHALDEMMRSSLHSDIGMTGPAPAKLQIAVADTCAHFPLSSNNLPTPGVVDVFTLVLAYFVLLKAMSKNS